MKRERPNAPIGVKLFVAFHILAILVWSLPPAPDPVRNGSLNPIGSDYLLLANERYGKMFPPIRAYLMTTGFWQYWDMFSPNPATTDVWGDAEVVREDGTIERYAYPRMYALSLWDKFMLERYRKFYERANLDENSFLWPRFAMVVASKVDNDPNNRPVEVRLWRHTQDLGEPFSQLPTSYVDFGYFDFKVSKSELDQMKQP